MTNKPKMVAIIVVFIGLILLVVVGVVNFSQVYRDRRQAERLLVSFRQISVGATSRDEALRTTRAFQPHRSEGTVSGFSEWVFHFDNKNLFDLRLAPYTSVDARLVFSEGVVQEKGVTVFVASGFAANVTERKRGFGLPNGIATTEDPSHHVGFNRNSPTNVRVISVSDDDGYGEKERSADWDLNLACLTQLGGCKDAGSMLPNALPQFVSGGNSVQ